MGPGVGREGEKGEKTIKLYIYMLCPNVFCSIFSDVYCIV